MEAALVLTRLAQYAAACAVGGSALFYLYGYKPPPQVRWPDRLLRFSALTGVLGALGWLMAQSGELGHGVADTFDATAIWTVASETTSGGAALIRAALFLAALALLFWRGRPSWRWTGVGMIGLAAAASMAWSGHGNTDEGLPGALHLAGDVLHLMAAAVWVGALFALLALATQVRGGHVQTAIVAKALDSFSRIGIAVVSIIVVSGVTNLWFLVGPAALGSLLSTVYGWLLAGKLVLFVFMLVLAAANRLVHTRRLHRQRLEGRPDPGVLSAVNLSLMSETALGVTVLAIVAWLGALETPGH